jgi:hypothetical protein
MSYKAMRTRADAAERAFEQSLAQVEDDWGDLKDTTRASMTPLRILGTGVLAGAMTAFAAPLSRIGGSARLMQLASSIATLLGVFEAKEAAEEATAAADTATVVAAGGDADAAQEAIAAAERHPQATERMAEALRDEARMEADPIRSGQATGARG